MNHFITPQAEILDLRESNYLELIQKKSKAFNELIEETAKNSLSSYILIPYGHELYDYIEKFEERIKEEYGVFKHNVTYEYGAAINRIDSFYCIDLCMHLSEKIKIK